MSRTTYRAKTRKPSLTALSRRRALPPLVTKEHDIRRNKTDFTPETFERVLRELQDGTIPLDRVALSDSVVKGLRVLIRKSGRITYHAHYKIDDVRPMLRIGDHPVTTLEEAREVASVVQRLADKGIDVQEGLHDRLIRELLEKGDKWKPE